MTTAASATSHVAQLAVEDAFGSSTTVRLARHKDHWIAWAEQLVGSGDSSTWTWIVHALAAGQTTGEAWGNLTRMCYRTDRSLTTAEASAALGVVENTVRQLVRQGRLVPLHRGTRHSDPSLFSPTDVLKRTGLARLGLGPQEQAQEEAE